MERDSFRPIAKAARPPRLPGSLLGSPQTGGVGRQGPEDIQRPAGPVTGRPGLAQLHLGKI